MRLMEFGFGLYGWAGADVTIAGGMRDKGFHPAGQQRQRFTAYARGGDGGEAVEVASLVLVVKQPEKEDDQPAPLGIVSITVPKAMRGQGFGRRIVRAIQEASPGDLQVYDIKKAATGFWRSVGAEGFARTGAQTNAVLAKPAENVPEPRASQVDRAEMTI